MPFLQGRKTFGRIYPSIDTWTTNPIKIANKSEILMSVSELFNILFKGVKSADEALQDILANIIMITYLLAKRLGISFNEIDYRIKEKTSLGIKEDHSIEKWYGDLTNLKNHIENRE